MKDKTIPLPNPSVQGMMASQGQQVSAAIAQLSDRLATLWDMTTMINFMVKDLYGSEEKYTKALVRLQKEIQAVNAPEKDPRVDQLASQVDELKEMMREMIHEMRGRLVVPADAQDVDEEPENVLDLGLDKNGNPHRPRG